MGGVATTPIASCNASSTHCRGHRSPAEGQRFLSDIEGALVMPSGDLDGNKKTNGLAEIYPAPRGAVRVHFNFRAGFMVQLRELKPRPRAGRRQDVPPRGIHHACTRLPRLRKKYKRHEQIPTPLVGHSCGASPSPHITPISGPFPGDIQAWAYVPGPLTGDIGWGPGTCARSPGRTPPNSHEKSAPTRCVVGWVESGYVERGAHDTRHLSSCLVSPSGIPGQLDGGSGG